MIASRLLILAVHSARHPSATELAGAIEERIGRPVSSNDLGPGACFRGEEEPTELECAWRQRERGHWRSYKSCFAIDAKGWHVIDWPPSGQP